MPRHVITKLLKSKGEKNVLKAVRKKQHVPYGREQFKWQRISPEAMEARGPNTAVPGAGSEECTLHIL